MQEEAGLQLPEPLPTPMLAPVSPIPVSFLPGTPIPVPATANMDRPPLIPPQTRVPAPPAGYPTLGFMAPSSGSGNTAHTANDSLATTNLCATPQSFYSG
eukprot:3463791-Amphidinium_carterae.1